jgi:hypothetical protein
MAGNSGKMTNEAIRARGPRMVLGEIRPNDESRSLWVIYREGAEPILLPSPNYRLFEWSKSYTLSYLLRIGRSMARL